MTKKKKKIRSYDEGPIELAKLIEQFLKRAGFTKKRLKNVLRKLGIDECP